MRREYPSRIDLVVPFAEHDVCIVDISELQWHITYNARLAERMFAKADLSRTWHQQLDVEVSDIRQTTELILEKVRTESVEIKKISDALKETEHELMLSRTKNADVQEKAARANQRAALERDEMRSELDKTLKVLQHMTFVSSTLPALPHTSFALFQQQTAHRAGTAQDLLEDHRRREGNSEEERQGVQDRGDQTRYGTNGNRQ